MGFRIIIIEEYGRRPCLTVMVIEAYCARLYLKPLLIVIKLRLAFPEAGQLFGKLRILLAKDGEYHRARPPLVLGLGSWNRVWDLGSVWFQGIER